MWKLIKAIGRHLLVAKATFRFAAAERWANLCGFWCGCRVRAGSENRAYMPLRLCGSGEIFVGERNTFGYGPAIRLGNGEIMIQARANDAKILIGSDNHFSNNINFVAQASIELGSRCSIGDGVSVYDCDFHELDPTHRNQGVGSIKPVVIGDNVWIGSRVIILKGVTIGENSVVGAMSLVVRSVPPNTVVAGNPARVVRVLT